MPRVLGLDHGDKRIGVALSDPMEMIASPVAILDAGQGGGLPEIERICREKEIGRIVVGLPLNMDGTAGPQAEKVQAFVQQLQARLPAIPVTTWDERLTSRAGERVLIEAGASRKRRREVLDKMAAQIMLQGYLDAHGPAESS
ncbi:MAG TPA: Holliday junction resolvase RuvX [Kiritimatiellia bacterium]|nr:Holliday junction resolvase RuvX [Kiritimatiellia bacterium]HSA17183.1 Holliday junction resolvase RuvX [Kiritimatiellia bacterium]